MPLCAALVLLAWAVHSTNLRLEGQLEERASTGSVGPLPNGKALRTLSLGFERLVADLFWLRTIYYVGDEVAAEANYPDAERLAHLVTDIDPYFSTVYVLMNSVLSGLRMDPDSAIELLKKGTEYSDYWRIHFLLGFNYFMEKGDYAEGARWIEEAAKRGGPAYLPLLASRLYAQGGDPETAMGFIQARLLEEEHPEIRKNLEKRYRDLWITRDLGRIAVAIEAYVALVGELPADVPALVSRGFLRSAPRDPEGGSYSIEEGRARSSLEYEILRVKE
ncbi:MAG: hypothetical protein V3V67_07230 [Myxococcota bacterium]